MKFYRFLTVLLLLLPSVICAQELFDGQHNQVDEEGRRQGHWKVFDGNGKLKFEGSFKDNIPFGEFKYYYPNGTVKAISHIYNNGTEARTKTFHPNGKLMAEGKYLNEKKDSIWHYYSEFDGILLSEEIYDRGMKTGKWRTFYPDGSVAEVFTYVDDKKHGPWRQYFTNGSVKLKATYIHGKLEGQITIYHVNGIVNVSGSYKNNFQDGIWMYFNDEAENTKKEIYEEGDLISREIYQEE